MNVSNQMFIISAKHDGTDEYTSHSNLGNELCRRGFKHVSAVGCYKGEQELSYVVQAPLAKLDEMLGFAREYKQESILYVDANRGAHLFFTASRDGLDGSERGHAGSDYQHIGRLTAVEEQEALKQDGYTKVDGQYYTVF